MGAGWENVCGFEFVEEGDVSAQGGAGGVFEEGYYFGHGGFASFCFWGGGGLFADAEGACADEAVFLEHGLAVVVTLRMISVFLGVRGGLMGVLLFDAGNVAKFELCVGRDVLLCAPDHHVANEAAAYAGVACMIYVGCSEEDSDGTGRIVGFCYQCTWVVGCAPVEVFAQDGEGERVVFNSRIHRRAGVLISMGPLWCDLEGLALGQWPNHSHPAPRQHRARDTGP